MFSSAACRPPIGPPRPDKSRALAALGAAAVLAVMLNSTVAEGQEGPPSPQSAAEAAAKTPANTQDASSGSDGTADDAAPDPTPRTDASDDSAGAKGEELIITGTRVKHSSLIAPVPVTTLDSEDLLLSGKTDVIDVIQQVPGLLSSINTAQTADGQAVEGDALGGSNVGVATLNLRGLGTKRTLVLVDGRRHVGGRAGDTAVDMNTIPAALVERIEIVTGGASAVYGADAVSGVVNIITKKEFDGATTRAQLDVNDAGHGARYYLAAASGAKFADNRGSAVIALEYRDQSKYLCGDAEFCRDFRVLDDGGNPYGTEPSRIFLPHLTFAVSSAMGRVGIDFDGNGIPDRSAPPGFFLDTNGNDINDLGETPLGAAGYGDWVVDNGRLRLFNSGLVASTNNHFGGDGIPVGPFNFETIMPSQRNGVVNALVRYRLGGQVSLFADGKFAYGKTVERDQVSSFNDLLTVSLANPYIPQPMRQAIDQAIAVNPALANTTKIYVTRDFLDLGDEIIENERQTFRFVTGLEGGFASGIQFEMSLNYGRTSEELLLRNSRIEDRFFAAIDVVTDAGGNPICRSELDPSAPPPPTSPYPETEPGFKTFTPGDGACRPLNIFGLGAPSQEAIQFVTANVVENSAIEQQVANLTLTGDSSAAGFELPGGPAGFAAGGEYRKEFSRRRYDGYQQSGLVFDGSIRSGVAGSYDVWEGFGELSLPLVADAPGAMKLTVDGAARFAHYSTVGSNLSWKAGGSWVPLQDLRFRGGYSVAVRAPNVGELFQPETTAFFRPIDPCDADQIPAAPDPAVRRANCAGDGLPSDFTDPLTGRFAGRRAGNANLTEEVANSVTVGGVFTPRFAPGLILAIDYFDISLEGAIDVVGDQDIVNNCYDDPNGLNNQFCDLFTRNRDPSSPTYLGLNFLRLQQLNIGKREVAGLDFEGTYTLHLAALGASNWGNLAFRLFGTWIRKLDDRPNPNDPSFVNPELAEIRRPRWVSNSGLLWNRRGMQLSYAMIFMSNQTLDDVEIEAAEKTFVNPWAGRTFIHNLSAHYQLSNRFSVYGGVANLADRDPLGTSTSFPVNPLGRIFFFGANSAF